MQLFNNNTIQLIISRSTTTPTSRLAQVDSGKALTDYKGRYTKPPLSFRCYRFDYLQRKPNETMQQPLQQQQSYYNDSFVQPIIEQPYHNKGTPEQQLQQQRQIIAQQQQVIAQQQQIMSQQQEMLAAQKLSGNFKLSQMNESFQKEFVSDDPVTELGSKIGRIQFSVKYEVDNKTLVVKIFRATNLEAKDIGGTSDPYVKVILLPDIKTVLTTRTKHKNCNPRWNETFSFEDYPLEKIQEMRLFLQVLDYDRFSKDDPIGELEIPLCDFDLFGGQILWKNLFPSLGKTSGRLGDLGLTLCYDNTSIKMTVVKACNLKAKDINGTSDPYVKIWLLTDGKKFEKKKTTTKECTLNPVYNESFVFSIPVEKIRLTSFLISVMDYDRFGRNEPIGQIMLGTKSAPDQVKHWNEMFQKPRQEVFKWHSLKAFE